MSQTLESRLAAHLRELLGQTQTGSEVDPELSITLQDDLTYCIPQLLRETYPEWEGEYLDGTLLTSVRKLAANAAELCGWAILLIDPGLTPVYFRLTLDPAQNALHTYDLFVGDTGYGYLGIARPFGTAHLIETRPAPVEQISWRYRVSRKPQ